MYSHRFLRNIEKLKIVICDFRTLAQIWVFRIPKFDFLFKNSNSKAVSIMALNSLKYWITHVDARVEHSTGPAFLNPTKEFLTWMS